MINIDFEHWYYQFTVNDLKNCSSYRKPNEREAALYDSFSTSATTQKPKSKINLTERQILYANEVFPEAAIAEPLADLKIWEQWRSGARIYPYPGKYAKLSITRQLGKTNSPSSVGVLGEIIAGVFGQAIISPNILVRVINRWPDFIFFPIDNRYSFLESKAFTRRDKSSLCPTFDIPKDLLKDALSRASQDILIDPFLKVWYSFTEIKSISPDVELVVKFFEFEGASSVISLVSEPQALIDGLAEKTIQKSIYKCLVDPSAENFLKYLINLDRSESRKLLEQKIMTFSVSEIENVINFIEESFLGVDINFQEYSEKIKEKIKDSINKQVKSLKITDWEADLEWLKRTNDDLEYHTKTNNIDVKSSSSTFYQIDIPINLQKKIIQKWKPDINQIEQPCNLPNLPDRTKLWRYGNCFFCEKDNNSLEEILRLVKLANNENQDNHDEGWGVHLTFVRISLRQDPIKVGTAQK